MDYGCIIYILLDKVHILYYFCFRVLNSPMPETKDNDFEGSSAYNSSSSSVVRDRLANNAHKLLRSMKQLLAREKTINITGSGSSNCQSQIAG